jgi:predicted DsbA family dithiol-disulfide isomerase
VAAPDPGEPPEPVRGRRGALVLHSDVACPWATVMVVRLRAARAALGLDAEHLPLIHLAHPLELLYDAPLQRVIVDAEIPACAAAAPEIEWSLWQGRLDEYPVSSLLACEAVQAARRQSEAAAEELDLALRTALFAESRCITLRREILRAAESCPRLDGGWLQADLDRGVARAAVMRQAATARTVAGRCTGYLVLPDATGHCNPGVILEWQGPPMPRGTPLVRADDATVIEGLVAQAAATVWLEGAP